MFGAKDRDISCKQYANKATYVLSEIFNARIVGIILATAVITFISKIFVVYWDYPFFDFPSFYFAAQATFQDQIAAYDFKHLKLISGVSEGRIFPYVYPPFSLPLYWPLTTISYQFASRLLLVFNCLAPFWLSWFLLRRIVTECSTRQYSLFLAALLLSAPTNITILAGQINFLIAALILVYWYLFKKGAPAWLVSLALVLAVGFKSYPIILLLIPFFARRWSVIILTIIGVAFLCLCSFLVIPPGTWLRWYQEVLPSAGYGSIPLNLFSPDHPENQSLNGFWCRVSGSLTMARASTYFTASVLILWAARGLAQRLELNTEIDLNMAIVLLLLQIIAPYSWQHHLLLPLIAIAVGIHYAVQYRYFISSVLLTVSGLVVCAEYSLPEPWLQANPALVVFAYLKLYAVIVSFFTLCWLKTRCAERFLTVSVTT